MNRKNQRNEYQFRIEKVKKPPNPNPNKTMEPQVLPEYRQPPQPLAVTTAEKPRPSHELAREREPPRVFACVRQSTDEEPLDGGTPTLQWTHASARGPTPDPPSSPAAQGSPLLGSS